MSTAEVPESKVPPSGREEAGEGVLKGGSGSVQREGSAGVPVGGAGGGGKASLVEMEVMMREQIRALQEQRAAAMMGEVVELQREKDLAMGRVRRLERSVAGEG